MKTIYAGFDEMENGLGYSGSSVPAEIVDRLVKVKLPTNTTSRGVSVVLLEDYVDVFDENKRLLARKGDQLAVIARNRNESLSYARLMREGDVDCYFFFDPKDPNCKLSGYLFSEKP